MRYSYKRVHEMQQIESYESQNNVSDELCYGVHYNRYEFGHERHVPLIRSEQLERVPDCNDNLDVQSYVHGNSVQSCSEDQMSASLFVLH